MPAGSLPTLSLRPEGRRQTSSLALESSIPTQLGGPTGWDAAAGAGAGAGAGATTTTTTAAATRRAAAAMAASLPRGFELPGLGPALGRLFGLVPRGRRRSRFGAASA